MRPPASDINVSAKRAMGNGQVQERRAPVHWTRFSLAQRVKYFTTLVAVNGCRGARIIRDGLVLGPGQRRPISLIVLSSGGSLSKNVLHFNRIRRQRHFFRRHADELRRGPGSGMRKG